MVKKENLKLAKVVDIRQQVVKEQASDKKWGKEVMDVGFSIVPSLLLRAQQRLGLNATQLAILLQLIDHWWDHDRKPYPSKSTLGERLNLSPRQIQRHVAELESAGLVLRIERTSARRGKLSNAYDLTGLVERLKKLAPEFKRVQELRRQVSKRGGLSQPPRGKTG